MNVARQIVLVHARTHGDVAVRPSGEHEPAGKHHACGLDAHAVPDERPLGQRAL
eukprot:CAMPEP_0174870972 /NCGR_PEP_ID=MMETSP1114-20130205/70656_1 /TAXON_ID=312471 /ORGANISM="Neobodo designis, Strain CCAP 1951/1" /LENGTH=53 /DNA_ID=CAMNT_0016106247 /DNA_START=87 /DNA_END=245 /DNA_ORIENTATION=-